jgi:CheY-like chemotaxis protein
MLAAPMTGEVGFWGNMLRFLVVDDSPNLATLIKTLLEGAFPDREIRIAHTNKDADSRLASLCQLSFGPTSIVRAVLVWK